MFTGNCHFFFLRKIFRHCIYPQLLEAHVASLHKIWGTPICYCSYTKARVYGEWEMEDIKYRNNTLGTVIDQVLVWLFFHAGLLYRKSSENAISSVGCYIGTPQSTWLWKRFGDLGIVSILRSYVEWYCRIFASGTYFQVAQYIFRSLSRVTCLKISVLKAVVKLFNI